MSETDRKAALRPTWAILLDAMASLAMIAVAIALLWNSVVKPYLEQEKRTRIPDGLVSIGNGTPIMGSPSAPVSLIEFSDFQCPFCGRLVRETLPEVIRRYVDSGKVQLAFKHLPLREIHPLATKAALLSTCAAARGRFWEFHAVVFSGPKPLTDEQLLEAAVANGIGQQDFTDCLTGPGLIAIERDLAEAKAAGISSTPTLLIGLVRDGDKVRVTDRLAGAVSADEVANVLDRLIEKR